MSYPRFFAQFGVKLIDNGYPIIPVLPGDKRPRYEEWQQSSITRDQAHAMGLNGSSYDGVGVQTAFVPAVDIDVYDEAAAQLMESWVDQHIGMGLLREGMAPKRLLVFRTDTPFPKTYSASYKIPGTTEVSKIEILGQGQQFVAFGIHPDIKRPYTWPDESILERSYHSLPVITHDQAKQICQAFEQYANACVQSHGWTFVKRGNWAATQIATWSDDPLDRKHPRQDISDEEIRAALQLLNPDEYADYGNWVRVGQMLHHQYAGTPEGLEIFDEWSSTLDKYEGTDAVTAKWESFNEIRTGGVVTIGSLLHEARQIRERETAKEEEIRKGMETYIFNEIDTELKNFMGDWFDFKSSPVSAQIKRFIGNVTEQSDAERYISKIGKLLVDKKLDGAPTKAQVEREIKPAYRKAGAAPGAVATHSGDSEALQYETNRDGEILSTQGNHNLGMRSGRFAWFGYDEFRGDIQVCIRGSNDWRALEDNDYPRGVVFLETEGFRAPVKDKVKDAMAVVAAERSFDSAINWAASLKWDGVSRLPTFASTYLRLENTPYHQAVWFYAWSAMAGRIFEPGIKADMVPVLVSKEGFNKSTFIECLAPIAETFGLLDMSAKDDDLSRVMRGKLVMEWAEMRGLKGRDEDAIKAFVTQKFQEWTPKWKEFSNRYYRRCFLFGTANRKDLLPAHGAARRWLPMELLNPIDLEAVIRDRDQLWAEAVAYFKQYGVLWQAAHDLAFNERDEYREEDPLSDLIRDWLDAADFSGGADGTAKRADKPFRLADLKADLEKAGERNVLPGKLSERLRAFGFMPKNLRGGRHVAKHWVREG